MEFVISAFLAFDTVSFPIPSILQQPNLMDCSTEIAMAKGSGGQGGMNQLGGVFVSRRPLPGPLRKTIVEMVFVPVTSAQSLSQLCESNQCLDCVN